MKIIAIITFICAASAFVSCGQAQAADSLWLEAQKNLIIYDDTNIEHEGEQLKLMVGFKWLYLYASQDAETNVVWGGQRGPGFELSSIGAGIRIPLCDYASIFAEGGRYFVTKQDDYTLHGSPDNPSIGEPYRYYARVKINEPLPDKPFDTYRTELYDNWGGQVGINIQYPLWYWFTIGANAGYRYLKIYRETYLRWDDVNGAYWVFQDNQDCSGWMMGAALKWEF